MSVLHSFLSFLFTFITGFCSGIPWSSVSHFVGTIYLTFIAIQLTGCHVMQHLGVGILETDYKQFYMCLYMYVYICACMYVCKCAYMCICCVYMQVCICVCMYAYIHIYICICICVYVCIYAYIYIYMYLFFYCLTFKLLLCSSFAEIF